MEFVKRLVASLVALATTIVICAGAAAAQDRPNVPEPSTGPTINTSDSNGLASEFYNTCESFVDVDIKLVETIESLACGVATFAAAPADSFGMAVSWTASKLWDDPVGKFTKAMMEGSTNAFATVMTFWMSVPTPNLTTSDAINGIGNLTWELQLVALAFGIAMGAIRIAIARRHAVAEGAEESAKMLLRTLFAISTLPVLVMSLHRVGDSFSTWVITEAADGDVAGRVSVIAKINQYTGMGPVLALVLAGIALFGSVAQLIALLIREAVLAIAVAVAPIAAASSVTGTGRQTWSSITSYTIAALMFKPAASLVYAYTFWAASSETAVDAVIGALLLAVAGVSLPALIRVIAPAVSTISAGGAQAGGLASGVGSAASAVGSSRSSSTPDSAKSSSGSGSASGSGTPDASGSGSSGYRGGYSGGGSSGSSSAGGGSGGSAGAASRGKVATAAGMAAGGVGKAAVLAGKVVAGGVLGGTSRVSSFAEGAISNGQVPR